MCAACVCPPGAQVLAESQRETVGYMLSEHNLYAVQFTLEQNDTDGMRLLLNFVLSVCGCTRWWDYEAFVGRAEEESRRVVGEGRAVCAMTGGLNSGHHRPAGASRAGRQAAMHLCGYRPAARKRGRAGDAFLSRSDGPEHCKRAGAGALYAGAQWPGGARTTSAGPSGKRCRP